MKFSKSPAFRHPHCSFSRPPDGPETYPRRTRDVPHASQRLPCITLSLAMISLVALFSPQLSSLLELDRTAVSYGGQWWRLLTGHLTHWNLDHFTWDCIVFLVLGAYTERTNRTTFI